MRLSLYTSSFLSDRVNIVLPLFLLSPLGYIQLTQNFLIFISLLNISLLIYFHLLLLFTILSIARYFSLSIYQEKAIKCHIIHTSTNIPNGPKSSTVNISLNSCPSTDRQFAPKCLSSLRAQSYRSTDC
jgi:hypothetical protein